MSRRRSSRRWDSGSILSAPPTISEESWQNDSILTTAAAPKPPELCRCPPAQANRLGGCRPALRWVDSNKLEPSLVPVCGTCLRQLVKGVNKRRDQLWVMGLAELYETNPENVDLDSVSDLFLDYNEVGRRAVTPDPRPNQLELD